VLRVYYAHLSFKSQRSHTGFLYEAIQKITFFLNITNSVSYLKAKGYNCVATKREKAFEIRDKAKNAFRSTTISAAVLEFTASALRYSLVILSRRNVSFETGDNELCVFVNTSELLHPPSKFGINTSMHSSQYM
jgi:hypothetical protein